MTIADRLRRLFEAHDITINAIAPLAGIDRQHVYRIMNGQRPDPRISTVERLVKAAGGTMAELYDDQDDQL